MLCYNVAEKIKLIREVKNMLKNLLNNYQDFTLLAEDPNTLDFIKIDNVTNETLKRYRVYEIDHDNKAIYLEAVNPASYILIATSDELELTLTIVKNINQAAQYMKVTATHLYRAYRNAGKPQRLKYNNFILYFLII